VSDRRAIDLTRGLEEIRDVRLEVAAVDDGAGEGGEPGRLAASQVEKTGGGAQRGEGRAQVEQLAGRQDTALAGAEQGGVEIDDAPQGRLVSGGEDRPRLARLGQAVADALERCLEQGSRAAAVTRDETSAASGGSRELLQARENLRPLQLLEGLVRDAEGHQHILEARPISTPLRRGHRRGEGMRAGSRPKPFTRRHRRPKRGRMVTSRPTEAVLDATRDLDRRSVGEILEAIHSEDRNALDAVGRALPEVARAVDVLADVLAGGGRWFNVGAGTSGRMGALDAAEIPPTFGFSPARVQAVIAGGDRAFSRAVEGAEDDPQAAVRELRERGLAAGDAVVALSASGHTPFALGGLEAAHEVGARTIAITCDARSPLAEAAEIAIVSRVGPEVIAGSTRMKGGLAQKMILHLLSTTVMVRLGRVAGNLMTSLVPASRKLRERAVHIVVSLAELDEPRARRLLEACDGNVTEAIARARGLSR
jgi:N-acetylmuramic acid 6-phosphate etherase